MTINLLFFYIYDSFTIYSFLVIAYCIYYFNTSNEYTDLALDTDELTYLKTRSFTNFEFFNTGSSIVLDTNIPFLVSFKCNKLFKFTDDYSSSFFFYKDNNQLKKEDTLYKKSNLPENTEKAVLNSGLNKKINYHHSIPYLEYQIDNDGERFIFSLSDYIKRQPLKKDSKWIEYFKQHQFVYMHFWWHSGFDWIALEQFKIDDSLEYYKFLELKKKKEYKYSFNTTVNSWLETVKIEGRDSIINPIIWLFLKEVHNITYYSEFWGEKDSLSLIAERKRIRTKFSTFKLQKGLWLLRL